jgi:putative inorganic carbon (HCO3(-)) transporter
VHTGLLVALALGLALSISVSQISLAALAGWVLLARRAGRIPPLETALLMPIAAFAGWSLVAALLSDRPLESLYASKGLLNLFALFVIAAALPDVATARRFATWLFVALAGVAALAVVQVAACPDPATSAAASTAMEKFFRKCARARGFYSIYMTLGGVLAMAMTAALPWLARRLKGAWWMALAWLVGLAALGLTQVRGAWIGFGVGALTAVAGLGRRGLVAVAALAVLVPALMIALPGVGARMRTIGSADDTTRDRLAMLEAGRRLGVENPLTGIGPGQLKHAYARVAPPEALRRSTSHLHNTPLQIVVERGVVGLALWLWIFVAFLVRGGAILRRLPPGAAGDHALVLGSLGAIVAFLVAGLFEYNFGDTEVLLVALAFMALPLVLGRARAVA